MNGLMMASRAPVEVFQLRRPWIVYWKGLHSSELGFRHIASADQSDLQLKRLGL